MDVSGSVMIALLPISSDWSTIKVPHMTLVYAGEVEDLQPGVQNELAKDACSLSMLSAPVSLRVDGVKVFGDDDDAVDVFTLVPNDEVRAMRRFVERWNKSEHDFNPHVTIGRAGTFVTQEQPRYITFDRITVGWGEDYLTFRLR